MKALLLFSGGQDSTTCLAWALSRYQQVETIGFEYGQRHKIELACRERIREKIPSLRSQWAERLGEDHLLDLSLLGQISETALTRDVEVTYDQKGLPTSFVPGRNLLFFTFAAALASRRGICNLIGGMCESDEAGYPDCRDDTLKSLQVTLNLGMAAHITLHTPLMFHDKAKTWQMAADLGGEALVQLMIEETHTCYRGIRGIRHEWGYGCGACPACNLRARGYAAYQRRSQRV